MEFLFYIVNVARPYANQPFHAQIRVCRNDEAKSSVTEFSFPCEDKLAESLKSQIGNFSKSVTVSFGK